MTNPSGATRAAQSEYSSAIERRPGHLAEYAVVVAEVARGAVDEHVHVHGREDQAKHDRDDEEQVDRLVRRSPY